MALNRVRRGYGVDPRAMARPAQAGELSQAQKDENDRRRRQFEAEQRRIKRVLARRRACLIKARDVYAASRCVQENPL